MPERELGLGIIGAGLMGRELASAIARWMHVNDLGVRPRLVHVADIDESALAWYERLDSAPRRSTDYCQLLADDRVEAVYCAVPHYLHEEVLIDVLVAGKHLLAEKPFGIDLNAAEAIIAEALRRPEQIVRVSSELPFYPGGQEAWRWISGRRFGRVIEVRVKFLHSSDLDSAKPINWKRQARFNGEYGCMGDLGMHVLHIPLRVGWRPVSVHAALSDIVRERANPEGDMVPCDTWDNAVLSCWASDHGEVFPLHAEMKRIAPGETNTWSIEVDGTAGSMAYTSKLPKTFRWMDYASGKPQAWSVLDLGSQSAYPSITGPIFESGFSDCVQQMLAAFVDELAHGQNGMRQPFHCVTPQEALAAHRIYTAAMQSHADHRVVKINADDYRYEDDRLTSSPRC